MGRSLVAVVAVCLFALAAAGGAGSRPSAPAQGNADLAVAWRKTPDVAYVRPGTTVTYTVTVTNNGPDVATGALAEIGVVLQRARIQAAGTSDGGGCTFQDVVPGVAGFVQCPLGSIGPRSSKTVTLRIRALPAAVKEGGVILVATLSASSDVDDPNQDNSLLLYLPGDPINYSVYTNVAKGRSTAKRIRVSVLIAPQNSDGRAQRYRRVEVFKAPAGANVTLRGAGQVERGTANRAGKLASRRFVGRPLRAGTIISVTTTKRGAVGQVLKIRVIAGGAALAGRQCIPPGGGAPRARC